jgi:hypothetical protein
LLLEITNDNGDMTTKTTTPISEDGSKNERRENTKK